MAKPNKYAQNNDNSEKAKREILNYKDLFIAHQIGGWKKLEAMISGKTKIGKKTHKQALEMFEQANISVPDYQDWYDERFDASEGPGRATVKIGDERTYKVQRLKQKAKDGTPNGYSGPFIRLPLDPLDLDLADWENEEGRPQVTASFKDGSIVITVA